ncbi:class I SAM-dependent methyltransferase [Exiguobacterium marinum]|uniref:Class I SAM-dependent methyltransferase n=1 Tax=Exiguobacterium marinum TaxID=273528 RepID=A0ABY7X0C3_9BACL|nr:methyltransferase domain-containing protein [Exiguobacterium marinum]WDH75513.1 class I SAM-dependent methyltransferase [Exiguobacterium marinum]
MVRQHRIEVEWTIEQLQMYPNTTVLELGCGAGDAMATILQKREDVNVIGFNRSKSLIASAEKRNATSIQMGRARLIIVRSQLRDANRILNQYPFFSHKRRPALYSS